MNYWETFVYGDTLRELREAAEATIKDFFGSSHEYVLDVRPHDERMFRAVGATTVRWEANVRVDF